MALKVGDPAPDFELPAVAGERQITIQSRDYLGRQNLVVSFHPLDWTPTCSAQVPELDARRKEFAALNTQVVDISVDSIPSHLAWREKELGPVEVPLCSDFYPHADVTRKFDILREGPPVAGISERAAFIVDKAGKIVFAKVYPIDQLPEIEELLRALRGLR